MKRFIALILFILILFISMTLLGIYIRDKVNHNNVNIYNITIELYKYKYGKDEIYNQPYKTLLLNNSSEVENFSDILDKRIEIPYDENRTLKAGNCIIKINYQKSSQNDLHTDVYYAWYDETVQTELILRKEKNDYKLPLESSKMIYKILDGR